MATIDVASLVIRSRRRAHGWEWTALLAALALVLAASCFAAYGFDIRGLDAAAMTAKRFACVIFFIALVAGPLSRLFAINAFRITGRMRRDILRGFCASYALYVAIALGAALWAARGSALDALVFAAFDVTVLALMAAVSTNAFAKYSGKSAQHVILGMTAIYFWLCFILPVLVRIDGPHQPNAYYGLCMLLMMGALLLRFADSYAVYMKAGRDETLPMH